MKANNNVMLLEVEDRKDVNIFMMMMMMVAVMMMNITIAFDDNVNKAHYTKQVASMRVNRINNWF